MIYQDVEKMDSDERQARYNAAMDEALVGILKAYLVVREKPRYNVEDTLESMLERLGEVFRLYAGVLDTCSAGTPILKMAGFDPDSEKDMESFLDGLLGKQGASKKSRK